MGDAEEKFHEAIGRAVVNWQSVEWSISAIFLWVMREQHHLRTIRQSAPRRNLQWSRQPPGGR